MAIDMSKDTHDWRPVSAASSQCSQCGMPMAVGMEGTRLGTPCPEALFDIRVGWHLAEGATAVHDDRGTLAVCRDADTARTVRTALERHYRQNGRR